MSGRPLKPFLVTAGWFTLLALVAFFPILLGGQTYDANDLLAWFGPFRAFLKTSVAQGVFPLWDPYLFCGQPFLADPQSLVLYPLHWLTLPFGIAAGMNLYTVLHFLLAAFGMRYWLRSLRFHEETSCLGGLIFALSNFFWWEIIHPPVLAAFAWLPWFFASLEAFLQAPGPRKGWAVGATGAMLFLAGSFQVSLGACYGGLFYVVVRHLYRDNPAKKEVPNFRSLQLALLGVVLGGIILLPQLIATAAYSKVSARNDVGRSYDQFNACWSLRPDTLPQILLPRAGVPAGKSMEQAIQEVTPDVGNDYLATFAYLGIWAPLLMVAAFFGRRRNLSWLLAALMAVTLFTAFGKYFFLHRLLCSIAPGFSLLRAPFRFLYLYTLTGSVLTVMGVQAFFLEPGDADGRRTRRTLLWVYSGLFLLIALVNPSANWRELMSLILGTAGGTLLLGETPAGQENRHGPIGRFLVSAALVVPLLLNGWGNFKTKPEANLDFASNTPWLPALQAYPRNQRVWLDSSLPLLSRDGPATYQVGLPENTVCALGYKIPRGYNPLMLQNYSDILQCPFPTLTRLTAVQRIVLGRDGGEIPGYRKVSEQPIVVYETAEPKPPVYFPQRWIVETDTNRRLALLKSPTFNPYEETILSDAPSSSPGGSMAYPKGDSQATLVGENPDLQKWKISSPIDRRLAVFSETAYPDWKAWVDGQPAEILTANHAFRALFLPAGEHELVFKFEPTWRRWLFPFVLFWVVASALFWGWVGRRPAPDDPGN